MNNKEWSKEKVERYEKSMQGWESPKIIMDTIYKNIKRDNSILEIGSGTGADYNVLKKDYKIIGSDYSKEFLKKLPKHFLHIDAKNFKVKEKFDAIFANKVLHMLSPKELKASFEAQYNALKKEGISISTLWYGTGTENMDNDSMISYNYNENSIKELIGKFKIKEIIKYDEFVENDSIILILEK